MNSPEEIESYSEPVSRLLTYGDADWDEWDDYSQFGFTDEHVPDLVRLGTDRHLLLDDNVDEDAMWAPMHAWRVLARMHAVEAVAPLVQNFSLTDECESDLISEGLQDVLIEFGSVAIDPLARFLLEAEDKGGGLVGADETLSKIGQKHPEQRDRIIQIITTALDSRHARNASNVNGFWICDLLELNAVESYPVIKKVFDAGVVDPMVVGDLEDVEIELGLREKRTTPRPLNPIQRAAILGFERGLKPPKPLPYMTSAKAEKKEKAKRTQEKKSRKRNRKKR